MNTKYLRTQIQFAKDNRNNGRTHYRNPNPLDSTENRRLWQLELTIAVNQLRRLTKRGDK